MELPSNSNRRDAVEIQFYVFWGKIVYLVTA
jgi:hypothetical protein